MEWVQDGGVFEFIRRWGSLPLTQKQVLALGAMLPAPKCGGGFQYR